MAGKKILAQDVQIHGELIRLFKNCPKPSGWFSGIVRTDDLGEICIAGTCSNLVSVGVTINAVANLVDGYYGEQYEAQSISISLDNSKAMLAYLSGPNFPQIGRTIAQRLMSKYGDTVVDMLINQPDTVQKDCKLSERQIMSLKNGVLNQSVENQLLQRYPHLGSTWVRKLVVEQPFGSSFHEINKVIQINPYDLLQELDIPFKVVDSVALQDCNFQWNDIRRVDCVFFKALHSFMNSTGGTYVNLNDVNDTARFRNEIEKMLSVVIDDIFVKDAIVRLSKSGHVYLEDFNHEIHMYDLSMKMIENHIVEECLFHLKGGQLAGTFDAKMKKYLARVKSIVVRGKNEGTLSLHQEQEQAIYDVIQNSLSCLKGGPGRGKTYVMKALASCWCEATNGQVLMLAPTGKAVNRLKDETGWEEAETIARCLLMNTNSYFTKGARDLSKDYICNTKGKWEIRKTATTLIIIDESSMINFSEGAKLLDLFHDCHIVFVGDSNQLPPIEPGPFFHELIDSQVVPVIELKKNHRVNSCEISENADKMLAGDIKMKITNHFSLMPCDDSTAVDYVIKLYQQFLVNGAAFSDVLLMSPMNKGVGSVNDINTRLQNILNPVTPNQNNVTRIHDKKRHKQYVDVKGWEIPGVKCNGMSFRIYDRVMCTRNHASDDWKKYRFDDMDDECIMKGCGYFNGDTGTIVRYYFGDSMYESPSVAVLLDDGRLVMVEIESFNEWIFGYCITIHKSQGSESKKCMVILPDSLSNPWYMQSKFLNQNLLYTGVTRAKDDIIIVGNMNAFKYCVQNPYMYHNVVLSKEINAASMPYLIQKSLQNLKS